jgi:hypothetical protein
VLFLGSSRTLFGIQKGATVFSERFGREVLRPLLQAAFTR